MGLSAPAVPDGDAPDPATAFFFASVAASRMPMVVSDPRRPDNPIILTNDAFLAMTGYERDEWWGATAASFRGRRPTGRPCANSPAPSTPGERRH